MSLFTPDAEIVFSSRRQQEKPPERVEPPKRQSAIPDFLKNIDQPSSYLVKKEIREYRSSLTEKEQQTYDYARQMTTTVANNRDSIHYLRMMNFHILKSLNETFPLINFSELEENMKKSDEILKNAIMQDNKPNTTFIPSLLGITDGLL